MGYHKAIETLREVSRLPTPASQLRAFVDTCAAIDGAIKARAVAEQWPPGDEIVTAELLLPLLTYVIVRARIPRLYSLTKYLEDFISESDEIHESGYVLVSVQT